jgi:hypothetical protein
VALVNMAANSLRATILAGRRTADLSVAQTMTMLGALSTATAATTYAPLAGRHSPAR